MDADGGVDLGRQPVPNPGDGTPEFDQLAWRQVCPPIKPSQSRRTQFRVP